MEKIKVNQEWLCKKDYLMFDERIAYKLNKVYTIKEINPDNSFNMPSELFDHIMYFDAEFKQHFELAEKTYTLTETFVKELCKEPNIKEAFVREGIVDEIIEIKKSVILNTPNDLELGQLIRKLINK